MFRDFEYLRDKLLAHGETFTPSTLQLLDYPDLLRACVGDAGEAACPIEHVVAEQQYRLELRLAPPEDQKQWDHLKRLEALPDWADLPPHLRVFFRAQCLRAHFDAPAERLDALITETLTVKPHLPKVSTLAGIIRGEARYLLDAVNNGEAVDLRTARRVLRGASTLLSVISPMERAICLTMSVRGYSCTAGCFTPTTPEA